MWLSLHQQAMNRPLGEGAILKTGSLTHLPRRCSCSWPDLASTTTTEQDSLARKTSTVEAVSSTAMVVGSRPLLREGGSSIAFRFSFPPEKQKKVRKRKGGSNSSWRCR